MTPRISPLPPDGELPRDCAVGRVVRISEGVAEVRTRDGLVRATYGAAYLARIARDPAARVRPGQLVLLRTWPGGLLTMEPVERRGGGGGPRQAVRAC
ncbi:hypothetical protein [Nocardioides massiliensis]|uniref:Uncharacterized protein n=1 Tax=Nocardioides massiliensis TaxID=1325935 RepID=A0ABT9NQU9_9ACTN|nr:hypothetical protein [Nocardioides massiliensis]MDP9822753.1 hypothetical protein [Nocardioides massiliensis]